MPRLKNRAEAVTRRSSWLWALAACGVPGLVLAVYPAGDLAVSGFFHTPGQGFLRDPVLQWIHDVVPDATVAVASLLALGLAWRGRLTWRAATFVPAAFALGPGLIVNALFKGHFGRARPVQILEFGGAAHFTPALQIADQCARNCSFTAGDPSVGFALAAFALIFPRHHAAFFALAVASGAGLGAMRIAQGGHFLSDVLFTGFFTLGATLLLARGWLKS